MIFKINRHILPFFVILLLFSCSKDDNPEQGVVPTPAAIGVIESIKTLGGTRNESARSVVSTTDGGYVVLGFTQSMNGDITDKQNESYDYWILKFNAANELQWNKTYGGTDDDRGNEIIQTQDGGYAILGYSFSNDEDVSENSGAQDYWVAKLDATGNISWQKSFGYSGSDTGVALTQSTDGGYLVTGVLDVTASGGQGNTKNSATLHAGGDYWAIKLDATGELEWSKFYGGNFTDTPEGVVETEDNGFIIAGRSDSQDTDISGNKGTYDFWVIRISSTGAIIWEKSFGGTEIDEARGITKSGDGNYIIAGDTRSNNVDVSNNNGAADLWIIKISPAGELLWEKTIGGTSFDVARSVTRTQDNGFLLSGSSRSDDGDVTTNQGQNDAWAVKVNSNGGLEWQTSIGGSDIDFAYGITELNDKTVVLVGETSSNDADIIENKGFTDVLLVKIK
jgi:hypothetical protein